MKERVIYNNYDLWEDYHEEAQSLWEENNPDYYITDTDLWDYIYNMDTMEWENEHEQLKEFFNGYGYFMIRGSVGRWNGAFYGGKVYDDFDNMFYDAVENCDYIKIWDENGHFYIRCSHHDGTNVFEVKRITEKAYNFIDNWAYDWNDKRTEEEIYDIVWNSNFLSSLPHYAHSVYGCKKYE